MGEEKANLLFPILQPQLVGIARLAARGVEAGHGRDPEHGVTFRTLESRSMLNRSVSKRRLDFSWSLNPYRGCEFGCRYCYARYTHEFLNEPDPLAFERGIYIKQNAAWLLRQELRQVKEGEEIALGTATDPYQPIERRAEVTRSLLEVLAEREGLRLGIVTKSTLIARDIDLLKRIAERSRLTVCLTITTPDARLARVLEPRAPRPDLRFNTVRRLREAGLRVGVLCSPLMPGITDTGKALDGMARRAKAAGACFFSAEPLFLKPCSRPVFLKFIEEHFPDLVTAYATRFADRAFVPRAYAQRMEDLVRAVVRKHGLEERYGASAKKAPQTAGPLQGTLWQMGTRVPAAAVGTGFGAGFRAAFHASRREANTA